MAIIKVDKLRKRYGDRLAVADVSFAVEPGEIFGIIGPNGAGKTTTVECVSGLRKPDGGAVAVDGFDPRRSRDEVRRRLGVQLQQSELQDKLKVAEALDLYASFYADPAEPADLMRELGLTDHAGKPYAKLSGGLKQRLSIALALVGKPGVAILDEVTTGLDPHARRETWRIIEGLRDRGVTIVLVTHYMDEAERLCDRLAVIDAGRVVATDTPAGLVDKAAARTLEDAFVALTSAGRTS